MTNYISIHSTQAAYTAAESTFGKPHIAYIEELAGLANCVRYMEKPSLHDYSQDYLTIESLQDNNTIKWKASGSSLLKSISISTNGGTTWTEYTSSTSGTTLVILNTGDKLLIKGSNTAYSNGSYNTYFTSTGNFNVEGNIMSLLYGDNFIGQTILNSVGNNLKYLFYNCSKLISAENLILHATTLASSCYDSMFYNCTSLTTAPKELPATTLADSCYGSMFQNCTSLMTAPELPAITLTTMCYSYMFSGCTSLTTAPELPATTLANNCYDCMFYCCTTLTLAPEELPATTLATECYYSMFYGCTSLTTAPALPATTLAQSCYNQMFYGCTSLTTAPELHATTLANNCYANMFQNCTLLTTAPELPATTLAEHCYKEMFYGCTSLNYIKCLATDISAFRCTYNWVGNVAASGTFVKNDSMSSWTTNVNGIPSGWTVQDAA